jgi:pyrimidine deaminase RibD-like protein
MIKPRDPRELVIDLLPRSICSVQVAAVLADSFGIFSWGWNSVGSGTGEHAEAAAVRRANKRRLEGATLYVASRRKRNSKTINSKPCDECSLIIRSWNLKVVYRDADGTWRRL